MEEVSQKNILGEQSRVPGQGSSSQLTAGEMEHCCRGGHEPGTHTGEQNGVPVGLWI